MEIKWIPTSERYPNEEKEYLVTVHRNGKVFTTAATYAKCVWDYGDYDTDPSDFEPGWIYGINDYDSEYLYYTPEEVSHWAELPAPCTD